MSLLDIPSELQTAIDLAHIKCSGPDSKHIVIDNQILKILEIPNMTHDKLKNVAIKITEYINKDVDSRISVGRAWRKAHMDNIKNNN
tara:strand:- start:182 stop:442 length:261 start_codon:yes stop_codon:yes gene_type:complete